jgi:glycosyltransferase involved in cell wall biosynthesis
MEAFAAADIFVHPSHYDAFGITILEAFSQKCAVITTDKGGLPWVVDKAGLVFEDNNLEDLKNKLFLLIKNKKLREEFQKKSYEKVKGFIWDKIAKELEHLYKETSQTHK